MRTLPITAITLALLGVSVVTAGCGAGSAAVQSAVGRATLTVAWTSASRLIPAAANAVTVTLSRGETVLATRTIARPESGSATETFDNLAAGEITVTATAFPNIDGSGVAQATATTSATIVADQTVAIGLTLGSTIDSVALTPTGGSVEVGGTVALSAAAKDASGNVVLTAPGGIVWSSLDPSVATVDASGLVAGVAAGSARIQATETESGKSATVTVTVTPPTGGASVTVR